MCRREKKTRKGNKQIQIKHHSQTNNQIIVMTSPKLPKRITRILHTTTVVLSPATATVSYYTHVTLLPMIHLNPH